MSVLTAVIFAASSPAVPFDRQAHIAHLDQLIEKKDYIALGKDLTEPKSREEFEADMDWLRDQWMQGTTALIPMMYARTLWAATESAPEQMKVGLRSTAAAAMLYTYAVTLIDGARCGDKSAPQHRRDQLLTFIPGFWSEIKSYSIETRQTILAVAVGMEQRTAAIRDSKGDVDFMCTNGMEEMTYNLRHGSVKEAPARPGVYGRHMSVIGDGTYKPSLLDEKTWKPVAEKARADLSGALVKMLLTDQEAAALSKAH